MTAHCSPPRPDTRAMRYISNTPAQQREMLATIGVGSIEDLLSRIPTKAVRDSMVERRLNLVKRTGGTDF